MEAVAFNENRNALAERVVSGEVPVEKAVMGLARVEVKIFYRKLDHAFQAKNSKRPEFVSEGLINAGIAEPGPNFRFPKEPSMPFRICKTFKALVA